MFVKTFDVAFAFSAADLRGVDLAAKRLADLAVAAEREQEQRLLFGTPPTRGAELVGIVRPLPHRPNEMQQRIIGLLAEQAGRLRTVAIAEQLEAALPAVASALVSLHLHGMVERFYEWRSRPATAWSLTDLRSVQG